MISCSPNYTSRIIKDIKFEVKTYYFFMGTHKNKAKCIIGMFEKKSCIVSYMYIDRLFFFHHILCINCKHNKQINEKMYIVYFIIHKNIFEILFSYIIYSEWKRGLFSLREFCWYLTLQKCLSSLLKAILKMTYPDAFFWLLKLFSSNNMLLIC